MPHKNPTNLGTYADWQNIQCSFLFFFITVRKPQPLSTTVTKNSHSKIVSRTSLFLEILERVQEVKYEDEEDHMTIK